jgi:PAS domain S-box-containing protein
MNWVQSAWTLIAGMSLALGLVQLLVWARRRSERQYLVYAIVAIGTAGGALAELRQLMSRTPEEFAHALRLTHISMDTALLCMPWFVRVRFGVGRSWLLWSATGLRLLVLVVSLVSAMTINLAQLSVHQVSLPGGVSVAMPVGHFNPWVLPAHLNLLLMLVFFAEALAELRRRGDAEEYRSGLRVCGSLIVFILLAGGQTMLVTYGVAQMPFLITPPFLLPILLLSYELSADLLSSRLARARLWQSELLLRESEERWELAGETVGIAPWSWYADANELRMSVRARELFGLERNGVVSLEHWSRLVHPEDTERIQRDVAQSMLEGDTFERDYRVLLPSGVVRWITTRGRIERDLDGKVSSMHGVSLDVTRVRQADEKFRVALESAPDAMFLVDEEGRIRLANARASGIFGYSKDQLLDMSLAALVPGWQHLPERRRRSSPPPGGIERRARVRELSGRRSDGTPVPVELAVDAVEGCLLLASVGDITERRNAEQERAVQRNELAHLSRVAVLGEMSASLAHELNQPLTAIVSNAQAALRFLDGGPEQQQELRETLGDIAASGTRAGEVIRRLRAMLKKEEAQRVPLDVNQLIHDVLHLYRSDLINRGVNVRFELDHGLPAVLGDRVQLQQVLLNLVINACDAMSELPGERRLCVCSRRLVGNEVEFAVCDVGPGIASDRFEQVFEPFVTSKSAGMGLGLSVCKTIVKSHGGRIWAANNNNAPGASFHVSLAAMSQQPVPPLAAELDRS